jgi:hypothetical protein
MRDTELLNKLKESLQQKQDSLDYSECNIESYEKNNWPYRQAHKNGYRSCIRHLLKLLDTLDPKEKKDDQSIGRGTRTSSTN